MRMEITMEQYKLALNEMNEIGVVKQGELLMMEVLQQEKWNNPKELQMALGEMHVRACRRMGQIITPYIKAEEEAKTIFKDLPKTRKRPIMDC